MVAMLVNAQWPYAAVNSERLLHPAFEASVVLRNRIVWFAGDGWSTRQIPTGEPLLAGLGLVPHPRPGPRDDCRQGRGSRTGGALLHRVLNATSDHGPRRCPPVLGTLPAGAAAWPSAPLPDPCQEDAVTTMNDLEAGRCALPRHINTTLAVHPAGRGFASALQRLSEDQPHDGSQRCEILGQAGIHRRQEGRSGRRSRCHPCPVAFRPGDERPLADRVQRRCLGRGRMRLGAGSCLLVGDRNRPGHGRPIQFWWPPSGPTAARCCGRSTRRPARPGWHKSRRCRSCGGSEQDMSSRTGRCAGVRSRTCPRPPP